MWQALARRKWRDCRIETRLVEQHAAVQGARAGARTKAPAGVTSAKRPELKKAEVLKATADIGRSLPQQTIAHSSDIDAAPAIALSRARPSTSFGFPEFAASEKRAATVRTVARHRMARVPPPLTGSIPDICRAGRATNSGKPVRTTPSARALRSNAREREGWRLTRPPSRTCARPDQAAGSPSPYELLDVFITNGLPALAPVLIHTLLVCRYSLIASMPFSRPRPEAL